MVAALVFVWLWVKACNAKLLEGFHKWASLAAFGVGWLADGYWLSLWTLARVAVGILGAKLGLWA